LQNGIFDLIKYDNSIDLLDVMFNFKKGIRRERTCHKVNFIRQIRPQHFQQRVSLWSIRKGVFARFWTQAAFILTAPIRNGERKVQHLLIFARGGEKTGQKFEGGQETYDYIAEYGDAIFSNGPNDIYVPPGPNGGRLKIQRVRKSRF
jgi:hypothetical protein